jgi:hypothetical protein
MSGRLTRESTDHPGNAQPCSKALDLVRIFRRRPHVPVAEAAGLRCQRCQNPIAANGRVVKAWSIVDGAPPAVFHLACSPPADDLRWRERREIPVTVARDLEDGG